MKVVIIGSGNVAGVMGLRSIGAGHRVVQVVGRREEAVAPLAREWNCAYTTRWDETDRGGDIYIVALSDRALADLGGLLSLPDRLVVHTAGAVSITVLAHVTPRCGVLYPLQSLRKEVRPIPEFPLLIDVLRPEDLPIVEGFARSLARQVERADDETRLKCHVAGVLVNNFTNYLYTLTEDFCRKEGLDFTILLPIIRETASRLERVHPRDVQTGPAVRGDPGTVEKHLEVLAKYDQLKELYGIFTQQIGEFYGIARNNRPTSRN
jgi:predicted short-subunit dehydrogenase-like oxidoreductase (DUF2520 family)